MPRKCWPSSGKWEARNPGKIKAAKRAYDRSPSGRAAQYLSRFKAHYGIDIDRFRPMPQRCEGCGRTSQSTLHLDHNDITGVVRGWLCRFCNNAIVGDDEAEAIQRLEGLTAYLKTGYRELQKLNPASLFGGGPIVVTKRKRLLPLECAYQIFLRLIHEAAPWAFSFVELFADNPRQAGSFWVDLFLYSVKLREERKDDEHIRIIEDWLSVLRNMRQWFLDRGIIVTRYA